MGEGLVRHNLQLVFTVREKLCLNLKFEGFSVARKVRTTTTSDCAAVGIDPEILTHGNIRTRAMAFVVVIS